MVSSPEGSRDLFFAALSRDPEFRLSWVFEWVIIKNDYMLIRNKSHAFSYSSHTASIIIKNQPHTIVVFVPNLIIVLFPEVDSN